MSQNGRATAGKIMPLIHQEKITSSPFFAVDNFLNQEFLVTILQRDCHDGDGLNEGCEMLIQVRSTSDFSLLYSFDKLIEHLGGFHCFSFANNILAIFELPLSDEPLRIKYFYIILNFKKFSNIFLFCVLITGSSTVRRSLGLN